MEDWRRIFHAIDDPLIVLGSACWSVFLHGDRPPEGCPLAGALRSRTASSALLEVAGRCFETTCWPILDPQGRPTAVVERIRPARLDGPAGELAMLRTEPEGEATRAHVDTMKAMVQASLASIRKHIGADCQALGEHVAAANHELHIPGE